MHNVFLFPIAAWALVIAGTYFDNYPPDIVQELYKSRGYTCYDYWYGELSYIFNATWDLSDPSFGVLPHTTHLTKYLTKYGDKTIHVRDLSETDKDELIKAFCCHLGMYDAIFPFRASDIKNRYNEKTEIIHNALDVSMLP